MNQNEGNSQSMDATPNITGYRRLSPEEVALVNEGKALAEQCGAYVKKVYAARFPTEIGTLGHRFVNIGTKEERWVNIGTTDDRWVSIGATHLQQGFMAITRGITQPTTF